MSTELNPSHIKEKVAELFAENPAELPAVVAAKLQITEGEVIRNMPENMVTLIEGMPLEDIYTHLRDWGDIMLVLDVEGSIFEMVTPFPKGGYKYGYYNMSDSRTPLRGHLRMDGIATIAMISKPFHGMDTKSVQFFSAAGKPVFKVYIRRNKDRSFVAEQLAQFEALEALAKDASAKETSAA